MTAAKAKGRTGERPPVRRLSGLESLQRRGRISRSQRAAGEAYGAVWRRSRAEGSLPSSLSAEVALGLGRGRVMGQVTGRGPERGSAMAPATGLGQRPPPSRACRCPWDRCSVLGLHCGSTSWLCRSCRCA